MIDATLTITGPQGPLTGGSASPLGPRAGRGITVLDLRHTLVSPRDPATGQATGRRRHAPVQVTKEIDRSTVRLLEAWRRNDVLVEWRLSVFGTDGLRRLQPVYTLELRRAVVVEISVLSGEGGLPLETVSFGYEQVVWTWVEGGVTTQDDWASPA